ncbi:CheR family methyltransferase [Capillimicrobium parvum]|uniref:Chemotaxis protein methyltransferase n=1 Tax=Capillimicrobium parvum TaxID=2884022 RepID=A0A9E6Y0Z3_9ACTN|nr:protein-glutamate O-methyltransferase CheR [Capillimicrobium parvum]UGS37612.1 Chemotaxis protein methyltransferase [Capillimicrobium parvum]
MPSTADDPDGLELELLLEAVHRRYGLDFRGYATASLRRRVWRRVTLEGLQTVTGLTDRILHDPRVLERLLKDLSINVTEMFRDPSFHGALREAAIPLLRTYPFVRVWNAGCSTGEEAYSLAIALHEAGLLERSRIYATDMNEGALAQARTGSFPLERMQVYTENYQRAGGARSLSEYYVARGASAVFDPMLARNMVFAHHNLVSDRSFNEFHLIVCRNVMIYFGRELQRHVHELFLDSLVPLGLLGLGRKEAIQPPEIAACYQPLVASEKLFRRRT